MARLLVASVDRQAPSHAASPGPAGRGNLRPARPRTSWRTRLELAFLIGPALLLFVGFVLVPIALAARYSLYNWSGFGPLSDFIGLHNYRVALDDPVFRGAIYHNLILAGLALVLQLPLSVGVALLLNRKLRGQSFLRLVALLPMSCPKPPRPSYGSCCWSRVALSTRS